MKFVHVSVEAVTKVHHNIIQNAILDAPQWSDFKGYKQLPGIEKAEFIERTENIIGSKIRVTNTDGSQHTEIITEWEDGKKIVLVFYGFISQKYYGVVYISLFYTKQPQKSIGNTSDKVE